MLLNLLRLYKYIYGDWADINSVLNPVPKNIKNYSDAISKKKAVFFANIENFYTTHFKPFNSNLFRLALRQLQATNLEMAIFGELKPIAQHPPLPSEAELVQQFQQLQKKYNFFDKNDQLSLAHYIKLCFLNILICDFQTVQGTSANYYYDRVYFMLAIFKHENIETVITRFDNFNLHFGIKNDRNPFKNTPMDLPPNIQWHLWRPLIEKQGPKIFPVLRFAKKIERQIGRVPRTLSEMENALCHALFKKADEHMELARLCIELNVTEEAVFDRCLELEKIKRKANKKSDNLPDFMIDGAEVGKPGYFLTKLPIDDPRSYLLGVITVCCQSVKGGDCVIERSVIDALTRANNCFYVLIKARKSTKNKQPLFVNNKLNHKFYKIIGEGYAWRSEFGNLTFDSWENKREQANDVIVPLLRLFAKLATQNSDILRVTIGTSSRKTPKDFRSSESAYEKMLEGTETSDASRQTVIYCNSERRKEFIEELINFGLSKLPLNRQELENFINPGNCNAVGYMSAIREIIDKHGQDFKLLQRLVNQVKWEGLIRLHRAREINGTSIELILQTSPNIATLYCEMLFKLHQEDLATPENAKILYNVIQTYKVHKKEYGLIALALMKHKAFDKKMLDALDMKQGHIIDSSVRYTQTRLYTFSIILPNILLDIKEVPAEFAAEVTNILMSALNAANPFFPQILVKLFTKLIHANVYHLHRHYLLTVKQDNLIHVMQCINLLSTHHITVDPKTLARVFCDNPKFSFTLLNILRNLDEVDLLNKRNVDSLLFNITFMPYINNKLINSSGKLINSSLNQKTFDLIITEAKIREKQISILTKSIFTRPSAKTIQDDNKKNPTPKF